LGREISAFGIAATFLDTRVAVPTNFDQERSMNHPEIIKLQKFLQQKFSNRAIDVRPRNKQNDSVEVYLGEEFLGLIYVDDEDGDRSYNFQMAILDVDLEDIR
jgi:hypothetical protein